MESDEESIYSDNESIGDVTEGLVQLSARALGLTDDEEEGEEGSVPSDDDEDLGQDLDWLYDRPGFVVSCHYFAFSAYVRL